MMLITDMARDMGFLFYLMCAASAAHLLWCGVMLWCAAAGKRAPLFVYFLMPCAAFLCGMLGVVSARHQLQDAVSVASVDSMDKLVLIGLSISYSPEYIGGGISAALLCLAALCVGVGNVLGASPGRRVDVRRGIASSALWLVALVMVFTLPGMVFEMERSIFLVVVTAFTGAGCVCGSSVWSESDEGMRRVVCGRFALAVLSASTLLCVGVAEQGRLMHGYGSQAMSAGLWSDLLDHLTGQQLQAILEQAWHWPIVTACVAVPVALTMLALAMAGGSSATRSIGSLLDASVSGVLMVGCAASFAAMSVVDVPVEAVLSREQVLGVVQEFGPGLVTTGQPVALVAPEPSSCVMIHQGGWMLIEMTPHAASRGCVSSRGLVDEGMDERVAGLPERATEDGSSCVQELGAVNASLCPEVRPLVVVSPAIKASTLSAHPWGEGQIFMDVLMKSSRDALCKRPPVTDRRLSSYLYWMACFKTHALAWRPFDTTGDVAREPDLTYRPEIFGSYHGHNGMMVVALSTTHVTLANAVEMWRRDANPELGEDVKAMRDAAHGSREVLFVVDEEVSLARVLEVCMQIEEALKNVDSEDRYPVQCTMTDLPLDAWMARQNRPEP